MIRNEGQGQEVKTEQDKEGYMQPQRTQNDPRIIFRLLLYRSLHQEGDIIKMMLLDD